MEASMPKLTRDQLAAELETARVDREKLLAEVASLKALMAPKTEAPVPQTTAPVADATVRKCVCCGGAKQVVRFQQLIECPQCGGKGRQTQADIDRTAYYWQKRNEEQETARRAQAQSILAVAKLQREVAHASA
jgi:hypothetical protein